MGKNNKARRAAKAKDRQRRAAQRPQRHSSGHDESGGWTPFAEERFDPVRVARSAWVDFLYLPDDDQSHLAKHLTALAAAPRAQVVVAGQELAISTLEGLWSKGWQPAELLRHFRRRASAIAATLLEYVISVDDSQRPGQATDPRWRSQVRSLGQRTISTAGAWLEVWREAHGHAFTDTANAIRELVTAGERLPRLEMLMSPPGAPTDLVITGRPLGSGGSSPMLERVRKLLHKAEATEFEEEAAAFTARAQELMARYTIDAALLSVPSAQRDIPCTMRVPIDAPYADAKSTLLATVAQVNRCRAVYWTNLEFSSVIGFPEDLDVVEMLFTSLLVQAQHALTQSARQLGARARKPSFRASFLVAFANRIGERLEGANDSAMNTVDKESATSAALVLRSRESRVQDRLDELFGDHLTHGAVRGAWDTQGHLHGRTAADRARLDAGEIAE